MISIGYFTNRSEPYFQWFCDSLHNQLNPQVRDQVEVIFVDDKLWTPGFFSRKDFFPTVPAMANAMLHNLERAERLKSIVAGRFAYQHVAPMPCMWQGPFRATRENYFAAGNARNTFLIVARHPYMVHVDDLSVLMPGWMDQVIHAAEGGYCVAGAYKKVKDLVVDNGRVVSCTEFDSGVDSRWARGSSSGAVEWSGGGLYGCSFGVPLDLMLKVNGSDGHCDSQGAEDYDLGIRLERAGGRFFYNRNMLTYESEEGHFTEAPMKRIRKMVTADRLPPRYEGDPMSDHVMLNRVWREDRIGTLSSHNIMAWREQYQATKTFPVWENEPLDWRDGEHLGSL